MLKRFFVFVFFSLSITQLMAQVADTRDPSVTEVWDPKPKVVTPGTTTEAPSDAIVLFDGKNLDKWVAEKGGVAKWDVKDGSVTVAKNAGAIKTKDTFGDFQLHIEWRSPAVVAGDGQNRGNSGIFLQERYELQVLDSYENLTYSNGQAGSIYKQAIPLVNAARKPGEWQVYDVIYTAPKFGVSGSTIAPARITVLHNGVLVQNNTTIWGPTDYRGLQPYQPHGNGSILLQDHGCFVSYRNIWIREL